MAYEVLVTALVVDEPSNSITVAFANPGAPTGASGLLEGHGLSVGHSTQAAPALASINGDLWMAFRGNDDTVIYTAPYADWGAKSSTGVATELAPSMVAWDERLWIAFIGEAKGHVELMSSANGKTWAAQIDTARLTTISPSITATDSYLFVAYVDKLTSHIFVMNSADAFQTIVDTGCVTKLAPAIAYFNEHLWIAFVNEANGHVEVINAYPGDMWSGANDTGQVASTGCALTPFGDEMALGFAGHHEAGAPAPFQLMVSAVGADWDLLPNRYPAILKAPALASVQGVQPSDPWGGQQQYYFSSVAQHSKLTDVLTDLRVEIFISEDLVISPDSGLAQGLKVPVPIGFQINGFSPLGYGAPKGHPDEKAYVDWQQYITRMWPGATELRTVAEAWPPGFADPIYTVMSNIYHLDKKTVIPAGTLIAFKFLQRRNGAIYGFTCDLTKNGHPLDTLNIDLTRMGTLTNGGPITETDFAPLVCVQVVLVGFFNKAQAILSSGAGTITCSSSTPMWPMIDVPDRASDGGGTAEQSNSNYSLVPAQPSKTVVQTFSIIGQPS